MANEETRKENTAGGAAGAAEAEEQTKRVFQQFISTLNCLKELDLTGIEPLLPPTYKAGRYRAKS